MLFTKEAAKANIRNRGGKRVFYLGSTDSLTWEARDYLAAEHIEVLPASQAKQEQIAILTGGFVTEKPEHLTHLNGDVLVHKSHPRIRFRCCMDALEAELLLCQYALPGWAKELQQLLELARVILRCDVLETPLQIPDLCGLTPEQLRQHSHFPQKYYGVAHFMPAYQDGEAVLRLNRLRCVVRQTELAGVDAFSDRDGNPTRTDILQALNRMSSTVYILMIRQKGEKEQGYGNGTACGEGAEKPFH